jgi:hypothetical protein
MLMAVWIIPATLLLVRSPRGAAPVVAQARPASGRAPAPPRRYWLVRTAMRTWRFWGTSAVFFAGSAATQMLLRRCNQGRRISWLPPVSGPRSNQ